VAILPAIVTVVLVVHLLLVQVQGMSTPPGRVAEAARNQPARFFPEFFLRDLFGWTLALALLVAMAALFPWELGEKADPFAPAPVDIRPEWYFVFLFETLKLVPGGSVAGLEFEAIPILLSGAGAIVLVLVPFLDDDPRRRGRSRLFTGLGVAALAYVIGMTAWGYRSPVPLLIAAGLVGLLGVFAWATQHRQLP
jgi:cytochrome b6